jgi:integrase/recombinase XerD
VVFVVSALEHLFVRPTTVDRVRAAWLGPQIERYVEWLATERYSRSTMLRSVSALLDFGHFAWEREARSLEELPAHVEGFVRRQLEARGGASRRTPRARGTLISQARAPVEGMLRLMLPSFRDAKTGLRRHPFQEQVPRLFEYLEVERGYRPATMIGYLHHLRAFEEYLRRIGVSSLSELAPPMLSAFMAESASRLGPESMQGRGGVLRVLLRYLYREGVTIHDLGHVVERGRRYRQARLPRAITWGEVERVLDAVDRRTPVGKRDYAVLLLLVTYGLRAREVAALTLDDIDWRRDRLRIPERKADHSTVFPLSTAVGEALLDYIRNARPAMADRRVFYKVLPPIIPLPAHSIGLIASERMRRAGVTVPRAGSHTLRHTCVQRLVSAGFSFKTIGDYAGHRAQESTQVYGKVAVEALRELAMGDGEEIL